MGAFLAAMLLKSKSAVAEKAAIAANEGAVQELIDAAQASASSTAVSSGYLLIGGVIILTSIVSLAIKFSTEDESVVAKEMESSLRLAADK